MKKIRMIKKYVFYRRYFRDLWGSSFFFIKKYFSIIYFLRSFFIKKKIKKLKKLFKKQFKKKFKKTKYGIKDSYYKLLDIVNFKNSIKINKKFNFFLNFFKHYYRKKKKFKKFRYFLYKGCFRWMKKRKWLIKDEIKIMYRFGFKYLEYRFFKIKKKRRYYGRKKIRLKFWLKRKVNEIMFSYFYGLFNIKKFKLLQDYKFYKTRFRISFILSFENMVSVILFRSNIYPNMYSIHCLMDTYELFMVNNKVVNNPYEKIKIMDDLIMYDKQNFSELANWYCEAIIKNRILFNTPPYLIFNFKTMTFCIWRNPFRNEVIGFNDFKVTKAIFKKSNSNIYFK